MPTHFLAVCAGTDTDVENELLGPTLIPDAIISPTRGLVISHKLHIKNMVWNNSSMPSLKRRFS